MEKVYIVMHHNGEKYSEDIVVEIMATFSTMEKAESYEDKWNDEYRKKGEDFFKSRGEDFDYEEFKIVFPEFVYISKWDLQ